jgi:hypothetical protein
LTWPHRELIPFSHDPPRVAEGLDDDRHAADVFAAARAGHDGGDPARHRILPVAVAEIEGIEEPVLGADHHR